MSQTLDFINKLDANMHPAQKLQNNMISHQP